MILVPYINRGKIRSKFLGIGRIFHPASVDFQRRQANAIYPEGSAGFGVLGCSEAMVEEEEQGMIGGFYIHGVLTRAISYYMVNSKSLIDE
jgi:hypothetical protein